MKIKKPSKALSTPAANGPKEWLEVNSTQISKIAYEDGIAYICFRDAVYYYQYTGVPQRLYDLLAAVDKANKGVPDEFRISLGSVFHFTIKIHPDKYPYAKRCFIPA